MLEEKELIQHIKESLEPADFQDERTSRIVSIMFDLIEQGKSIEPRLLMNYLPEEDISQLISESMFLPEGLSSHNKERVADDCIRRLKSEKLRLKRHNLHNQIETAQNLGEEEKLQRLMQEFHNLVKKE